MEKSRNWLRGLGMAAAALVVALGAGWFLIGPDGAR
jgi:hypothetical protein